MLWTEGFFLALKHEAERERETVMHQMERMIGSGVAFAAGALLLSACGSSGTNAQATRSSSASPTTQAAVAVTPSVSPSPSALSFPIPNGTYEATATRQEALAKGFSKKEIDAQYGPDGKLPVTFVLDNGALQVFVVGDDGVKELGDTGTYTATEKRFVVTDEGEGCSGCVVTWLWSFDGKVLSLKLVSDSAGRADFRGVRLVAEHDYVKTG